MIKNDDGTVTLTQQEIDWLNENFQGGKHSFRKTNNRYQIIDNEGDACGWGIYDEKLVRKHIKFMDEFTELSPP
jgi:hypothetical protein